MFNYKSIKVITKAKCYTNYNFGSDLRALALKWPQGCENGPHHWLGHFAYNQWGTIKMLYAAHILYTGLIPYQKRNECGQYCRSYSGHKSIYRQTDGRTDKPTDKVKLIYYVVRPKVDIIMIEIWFAGARCCIWRMSWPQRLVHLMVDIQRCIFVGICRIVCWIMLQNAFC